MAGTGKAHLRDAADVLLRVEDLVVEFPVGRTGLKVNAVSGHQPRRAARRDARPRRRVAAAARPPPAGPIMQLPRPTQRLGPVRGPASSPSSTGDDMREARTRMQMIFQDPISSLNPRRKVRDIVLEPLTIWKRGTKAERDRKVDGLLEEVGIDPQRAAESQPHQFSGGQCQRISHRPLAGARPDADHLRRAGVGARRQRAGPGAQPARGPEGPVRADADLHRPRPRRREEHQRPGRGDVPRQALRGRPERRRSTQRRRTPTPTCC